MNIPRDKALHLAMGVGAVAVTLGVLGNLPTSSGAYPLMMKIKGQAEAVVATQQTQAEQ